MSELLCMYFGFDCFILWPNYKRGRCLYINNGNDFKVFVYVLDSCFSNGDSSDMIFLGRNPRINDFS